MKKLILLSVLSVMLSGCVAGHVEYADNPNPPPQRIIVKDLSWYEYDSQWFNNGTKAPAWAYGLMPVVSLFY